VLGAADSNMDGSLGDINVFFNSTEQACLEQTYSQSIMENKSCRRYVVQKLTQSQRETMC
jgi:hypothetical protein